MFSSLNRSVHRCGLLMFHRASGVELTVPALQEVSYVTPDLSMNSAILQTELVG